MFLASAAAVTAAACSGDGTSSDSSSAPTTSRPDATTPTSSLTTTTTTTSLPPIDLRGDPFTLGVASGDPDEESVVLWTRLAPLPLDGGGMPPDDVRVVWEVSADAGFTDLVAVGSEVASADHGHCVHAIAPLPPGSWFYRFRVGEYISPVGLTRPAPIGDVEEVQFAAASCQHYEAGYYAAHRDIAQRAPDFLLWLGDYIYEGAAAADTDPTARTHLGAEPTTVEEYRNRYARYKSDLDLQAAHAACPWFIIWDDHEVENNYAGLIPQGADDAASFEQRRSEAYKAWWEHQPVDLPAPPEQGDFPIYRSMQWGSLLTLALVDGRQYRSDQACGDQTLNLDPPCPETFDANRTMLGDEQEQWLLGALAASTTTWNVLTQQTVFGDVTIGDAVLNYDQWDGYPVQRNRIVEALDPTANTIVLTGDIHFAGVGTLRIGERGTGTPVGVEFVATSISSGGLVNPAVTDVVKAIPDILDAELDHRGYILHRVTAEAWTAEYRMVESVKVPDSPVFVHATYIVDAGTNTARFAT